MTDWMLAALKDMFPDEVLIAAPQSETISGAVTYGSDETVRARCAGQIVNVAGADGQMKRSTIQAILYGAPGSSVRHRFTLPARFDPRQPKAIAVQHHTDEGGAHHETVYF